MPNFSRRSILLKYVTLISIALLSQLPFLYRLFQEFFSLAYTQVFSRIPTFALLSSPFNIHYSFYLIHLSQFQLSYSMMTTTDLDLANPNPPMRFVPNHLLSLLRCASNSVTSKLLGKNLTYFSPSPKFFLPHFQQANASTITQ